LKHWERSVCFNEEMILEELPFNIRHDVAKFKMRLELKLIPLFRSAPDAVLEQVGEVCEPRIFPPFSIIAQNGDASSEMFFVHKGHAVNVMEAEGVEEHEQEVQHLSPGAVFNERALLLGQAPFEHTVYASTEVQLFALSKEALDKVLALPKNAEWVMRFRALVRERLEKLDALRTVQGSQQRRSAESESREDGDSKPRRKNSAEKIGGTTGVAALRKKSQQQIELVKKQESSKHVVAAGDLTAVLENTVPPEQRRRLVAVDRPPAAPTPYQMALASTRTPKTIPRTLSASASTDHRDRSGSASKCTPRRHAGQNVRCRALASHAYRTNHSHHPFMCAAIACPKSHAPRTHAWPFLRSHSTGLRR
jgi:CRP-like cAMP-binding protein